MLIDSHRFAEALSYNRQHKENLEQKIKTATTTTIHRTHKLTECLFLVYDLFQALVTHCLIDIKDGVSIWCLPHISATILGCR